MQTPYYSSSYQNEVISQYEEEKWKCLDLSKLNNTLFNNEWAREEITGKIIKHSEINTRKGRTQIKQLGYSEICT